jgi:hypothetical protein
VYRRPSGCLAVTAVARGYETVQVAVMPELPLPAARKPNPAEAPGARLPFQVSFVTVAVDPVIVYLPPQSWVKDWPEARVSPTFQPEMAEAPAFTSTCPWNPPGHCPIRLNVATHAAVPPVVVVGGRVVVVVVVGG